MKYARIVAMALLATSLLPFLGLAGCNSDTRKAVDAELIAPTPAEWRQLEKMHIVFGHQSVGANLIAGVKLLAAEQGAAITFADTPTAETAVVIRQFYIGSNGNPQSKLDAFDQALAAGAAQGADVAEMKFCFVDFPDNVDPKQLAQTYIKQIEVLSVRYPDIIFLATTSPLTTIQSGPKAWLKQLMGKFPGGYQENMRRHEFNQTLRAHYGTSPNLFDLAQIESGDGKSGFEFKGQSVEALAPEISDDGGHLNTRGQRLLAAAWIHHLTGLKLHD